ncbi:hypothetical protein E2C01_089843 [Portunus trituberculatus]|uniref:Uncharacterized protein n=1 Tax=Portunus trituberculatus TaxID=210409 RepID=A0A5B7JQQ4_PORTR|nr:hypothetical protein [Portunus trituberculatus]
MYRFLSLGSLRLPRHFPPITGPCTAPRSHKAQDVTDASKWHSLTPAFLNPVISDVDKAIGLTANVWEQRSSFLFRGV